MFRKIFAISGAVVAVAVASLVARAAGPNQEIQDAAKKLADSPNYSWTSTVEAAFGAGTTEGKTQKDGLTWLTITRNDNTINALIKGENAAIKMEDGWKSVQEVLDAAG